MNKKIVASILLLMITLMSLLLTGCGNEEKSGNNENGEEQVSQYQNISGEDLKTALDNKESMILLDVREDYEYKSGHLEGSILIPTGEIQDRYKELDQNKTIVVICASGARSAQVAQFLVEQGYSKVKNLEGGLASWPYPEMIVQNNGSDQAD